MLMEPELASARISEATYRILIALGLLLLFCFVLFAGLWYYRRWLLSGKESASQGTPWTLEDLRRMRDREEITETEYQALRQALIGSSGKREASRSPSAPSPPPPSRGGSPE